MTVLRRDAARVIVLDEDDRVLLLRQSDPGLPGWCWTLPGGGLDPGEEPADAARRELLEETGLRCDRLGPCVWRRTVQFRFAGVERDQHELIYVARVSAGEPRDALRHTEIELASLGEERWWTLAEIAASGEEFVPAQLGSLLGDVIAGDTPAQPLELTA